jgi:tetratricopeptide (TPR) repeat protein
VILNAEPAASVNFSLLEMPDRIVRWTGTRLIDFADLQSLHSELARVANCVATSFDICEQRHFTVSKDRSTPGLGDRNWRIRFHINQFTEESFERARTLIEEAKEQCPENGEILMLQANLELWQHWIERSDESTSSQLAPLIRAAMRADPADARGPLFYGILDTWHRRSASALTHLNRACELDPSFAQAFVHLGAAHYLSGKPEAAIDPLEHALFLAPLDPKRFFAQGELGTAYWMLGRYEECLAIAHNIQATHPGYVLAHVLETASYAAMGLYDDARRARAKMLDAKPHLYRSMLAWIPFIDRDWARKMRDGVEFDARSPRNLHIVQNS